MLDSLFAKCTSLAHFNQLIGVIDQVGNIIKNSFGGSVEKETLDIIISLLEGSAQSPVVTPAAPTSTPAQ